MSWLEPPLVFSLPFPPLVCRVLSSHPSPCVCVSPFPCLVLSSLCVCEARHIHCVCVLVGTHQHTALLCTILSRLLFLCLSSTTITLNFRPSLSLSERNEWGEWQAPSTHLCLPNNVWKKGGGANTPWLEATAPQSPPLSLFAHCVVATLSAASLTQPHKKSLSCKKERRKKEITTPGVPRLSPTLVLTRPEQA